MVSRESANDSKKCVLSTHALFKELGGNKIINGISWEVTENKTYAIIGVNGAGKTTLLRLISGLFTPTSGKIVSTNPISVLLEQDNLFPQKTVIENIRHFCLYFQLPYDKAIKDIDRYLTILELDQSMDKPASELSKGMKRKLSILLTVMRNCPTMIFDEPFSGLDLQSKINICNLFIDLKSNAKTIIFTSHDLSEVEKVSDHILIMRDGCIVKQLDNKSHPNLEQAFMDVLDDPFKRKDTVDEQHRLS